MRQARIPDCHPERKYHAKGLCKICYQAKWDNEHYESNPRVAATCHPERKHKAHGLCKQCFERKHHKENKVARNNKRRETRSKPGSAYEKWWAKYYADNKDEMHVKRRAREYGLTVERMNHLFEIQDSKCAICKEDTSQLCIDHNHQTGFVRGILCNTCNTGLGMFRDSPMRLKGALKYLRCNGYDDISDGGEDYFNLAS